MIFSCLLLFFSSPAAWARDELLIFAGAASKPPTDALARLFEGQMGVEVKTTYGGSGFVLSQMKLARRGDIYFPGSSDFMEKAIREGVVFAESEQRVVYLVPAINVPKGNPRRIQKLEDLLQPGIRLAIAIPEAVCVGAFAVEIIEKKFNPAEREKIRRNIVTMVESCEKTANMISLGAVDAVLGWHVFSFWDPQRIETIRLAPHGIPRIAYIPAAVSRFTRQKAMALKFLEFLVSSQAKEVFKRHGYLMSVEEARAFTLPHTPVGGEYEIPEAWRRNFLPSNERR